MRTHTAVAATTQRALARRLRTLQVGVALQGLVLWIPVEKLFMTEIGFTPVSIGVMAAAYAAVVPLLEIPSGILADRSSRNLVMVAATIALAASSALGGASRNVATYIAAAMLLGVYFALNSGTVDSIVYDTVLEETGSSHLYETWVGRVRMAESTAMVISALAGGLLASATSTLPFLALVIAAFLRFREPRLHRADGSTSLRRHIALTFTTMTRRSDVRQVILLAALTGLISTALFEFGPLWLVAFAAPAALFGPYWAALMATLGLGGYLTSKLNPHRRIGLTLLAGLAPIATLTLTLTRSLTAAIAAQVTLGLVLAITGIHAGRLLHDAVPANLRTGLASGVGTLSWLLFPPISILIGWLAHEHGIARAGWVLTTATLLVAILLNTTAHPTTTPVAAEPTLSPQDLACRELVELVTDYLDGLLPENWRAGLEAHLTDCDGCTEYIRQIRTTLHMLTNPPRTTKPTI